MPIKEFHVEKILVEMGLSMDEVSALCVRYILKIIEGEAVFRWQIKILAFFVFWLLSSNVQIKNLYQSNQED